MASELGVGYTSTYDPRYKRVIIHKRDFKLRPEFTSKFYYTPDSAPAVDPGEMWFDGEDFYYQIGVGDYKIVNFEESDYFENKSFTISYSFLNDS